MKFFKKNLFISIIYLGCIYTQFAIASSTSSNRNKILKITKIDSQHKGIADVLIFEISHLTTALKIDGTMVTNIEIQKNDRGISYSTKYKKIGNKFILVYAYATSARYFYNLDSCSMKTDSDSFSISSLGSLTGTLDSYQGVSLSPNCKQYPDLQKQILSEFSSITNPKNKDDLVSCILQYDITAGGKWKSLPDSLIKFGCASKAEKYDGIFDSKNNEIKISNSCLANPGKLSFVMKEEILHSFGVKDEALAKCIAQCPSANLSSDCKNATNSDSLKFNDINANLVTLRDNNISKIGAAAPDGSMALNVTDDYNSAKTIEVPREIAVAQVPQPAIADLKMSHSVETMTVTDTPTVASAGGILNGGSASGTKASSGGRSYSVASYPNSMMQFAATAVLPEKAFAQGTSSTDAGGTPSRSSRSPASTSEALRHTAASRLPASSTALTDPKYSETSSSAKTMNPADASGENTGTATTATGASREVGKSNTARAMHSFGGRSGRAGGTPGAEGDGNAEGNLGASVAGSGSGGGNGSSGGSRSPASVGSGHDGRSGVGSVAGSRAAGSPGNLVRYFQTAPYGEIKQRLRDPKFIRDLQKNSTTVFDTQGNRFGAAQGQVIFSDKGNRFVKEK